MREKVVYKDVHLRIMSKPMLKQVQKSGWKERRAKIEGI